MTTNFADTLDIALQRLKTGEPVSAILVDYPAEAELLRPLLNSVSSLEPIRSVEFPVPQTRQADRSAFITNIEHFQQQAVSQTPVIRLKEQVVHLFPSFSTNNNYGKEHRRMSTLLIKAAIVFSMVFGTMGGTAVMASNSLPNSPVYPLKLAMEQARLSLTTEPSQLGELHLTLAQVRAQEMLKMALQGDVPPEETGVQLQQQLQLAMQLAAELPEEDMLGLLAQVQQMAQTQTQQMTQAQAQVSEPAEVVLGQAFQYMNQAGEEAQAGLEEPLTFRARFGKNRPETAPDQPAPVPPGPGDDTEPVVEPTTEPIAEPTEEPILILSDQEGTEPTGTQNQYNKPEDLEAGQHGQNCSSDDGCVPVEDQNQYEENLNTAPGDNCTEPDCVPIGDEHKYGQDDEAEPGGPHDENCTEPDCVPAGDEHKYGQDDTIDSGPHDDNCTLNTDGECVPAGDENKNGQETEPAPQPADNDQGQQHSGGGGDGGGGGGKGGKG